MSELLSPEISGTRLRNFATIFILSPEIGLSVGNSEKTNHNL